VALGVSIWLVGAALTNIIAAQCLVLRTVTLATFVEMTVQFVPLCVFAAIAHLMFAGHGPSVIGALARMVAIGVSMLVIGYATLLDPEAREMVSAPARSIYGVVAMAWRRGALINDGTPR
jgi:hypothetical protein